MSDDDHSPAPDGADPDDQAPAVVPLLDAFLHVDARDPLACEMFRFAECTVCRTQPDAEERCQQWRCTLRHDVAFSDEQVEIARYRHALADPELASQELLDRFNGFIRAAGCATVGIMREGGWLVAGYASIHLRDRLHGALVQEIMRTAGVPVIPGNWLQGNAAEFEQYVREMRRRAKARDRLRAIYLAGQGMSKKRIATLLARDRGTVTRWLERAKE